MQAVFLVQLENAQTADFRPLAPDQGQQVIPPLAGVHQVEDFRKREGPHIESALFGESITGEQKGGFAFDHVEWLLSCSW